MKSAIRIIVLATMGIAVVVWVAVAWRGTTSRVPTRSRTPATAPPELRPSGVNHIGESPADGFAIGKQGGLEQVDGFSSRKTFRFRAYLGVDRIPIVNERITFAIRYPHDSIGSGTRVTDQEGEFRLTVPELPINTRLEFSHPEGHDTEVVITDNKTLEFDVVFEPYRLTKLVEIVSTTGEPVPHVDVAIAPGQASHGEVKNRRTNAIGELRLNGLDPGMYRLIIRVPSVMSSRGVKTIVNPLRVTKGEQRTTISIDVGRLVDVLVEDRYGKSVDDSILWVGFHTDSEDQARWSDVVVENGHTILCDVPNSGVLDLFCIKGGLTLKDSNTHQRIDLGALEGTEIVLTLELPQKVQVRIVDAEGTPVVDASSIALDKFIGPFRMPMVSLDPAVPEQGVYDLILYSGLVNEVCILSSRGGTIVNSDDLRRLTEGDELALTYEGVLFGQVVPWKQGSAPVEKSKKSVMANTFASRAFRVEIDLDDGRTLSVPLDWNGRYFVDVGGHDAVLLRVVAGATQTMLEDADPQVGVFETRHLYQ